MNNELLPVYKLEYNISLCLSGEIHGAFRFFVINTSLSYKQCLTIYVVASNKRRNILQGLTRPRTFTMILFLLLMVYFSKCYNFHYLIFHSTFWHIASNSYIKNILIPRFNGMFFTGLDSMLLVGSEIIFQEDLI